MSGNYLTADRPCPRCGMQLERQLADPPWESWWECPADGTRWRVGQSGQMVPADQVKPLSPFAREERRR